MITGPQHIIQKQTLELSGNNLRIVQQLESDSHRIVNVVLNPVIERCFDEADKNDEQILFQRIEIDLGTFQSRQFYGEISTRLRIELSKALHRTSVSTSGTGSYEREKDTDRDPGRHFEKMPAEQALLVALLFYLNTGRLPWWMDSAKFNNDIAGNLISSEAMQDILKCFRENRHAVIRAVEIFSDEMLGELSMVAGFGKTAMYGWQELQHNAEYDTLIKPFRNRYWQYCLSRIAGNLTSVSKATSSIVHVLSPITGIAKQELEFFFTSVFGKRAGNGPPYFTNTYMETGVKVPDDISSPDAEPTYSSRADQTSGSREYAGQEIADDASLPEPISDSVTGNDVTDSGPETIDTEKESVSHSGIVIVHPFLKELFRSRELLEEAEFVSEDARCHAVRMLDYISTGQSQSPEYELILAKLMCGIPWHQSLSHDIMLSQDDTAACDELLEAVIDHWKALGKTSVGGLREGFFSRTGILDQKSSDWLLRIESKAQDVLLARLPWGISTIRFSWMPATLHVEWA